MALSPFAKGVDISEALTALEPLSTDTYFVAFGSGGQQFCGAPNGYSAVHLPSKIVRDLANGRAKVKQIVWASFGSNSDSWFFRYTTYDGRSESRFGSATPAACRQFIEYIYASPATHLVSSLHVQLGRNDSFLAWTNGLWICHKIPSALKAILIQESLNYSEGDDGLLKGAFKYGPFAYASWHGNGSFYVKGHGGHFWDFQCDITRQAWNGLWQDCGQDILTSHELEDLAYAAIDPYSADGDTFVFIKTEKEGKYADFVLRFAPESMVYRITLRDGFVQPEREGRLQHIPTAPKSPTSFRWARAKHTGRPHPRDERELPLEKNQMLKVLEDRGRDWYIAQNARRVKGWVHKIWLDFSLKKHVDPEEAYALFKEQTTVMLKPGTLREFPSLSRYMDACAEDGCDAIKRDSDGPGICTHDLERLLRGSGTYSVVFLKDERNVWHPDKFARFCHPDSLDDLKAKAGTLFVLFGVLIDLLQNPPQEY